MKKFTLSFLSLIFSQTALAELGFELTYENAIVWESRSVARIPNASGTLLDLNVGRKQPLSYTAPRIYLSYSPAEKHELRVLWAPLSIAGIIQRSTDSVFMGETFAANQNLETFYKFNSYRLSYIYHFSKDESWNFALGLTAKIRDAEIRISQGSQIASKKNVGFVPLLHFQIHRVLNDEWDALFDLDASAAPQGRAFDAALKIERLITYFGAGHRLNLFAGYRTVEGGADVDEVYNFAWFHSMILGVHGIF